MPGTLKNIKIMATTQQYYFLIDTLLKSVQNESLYYEDGKEKDFDTISVGQDDLLFVGTLLKKSCIEVSKMLHRLAVGLTDPYQYGIEIEGQTGLHVSYTILLPEKTDPGLDPAITFDVNLTDSVDSAIEDCIVAKTLYKWFRKKGRNNQDISDNQNICENELRQVINYRKKITKTYNRY